jgi:PLP dependent protein
MTVRDNFLTIQASVAAEAAKTSQNVALVAVSKTYDADHIRPVLELAHRVFGENRVQEAQQKWPSLRQHYPGIELHLIGPLQSNKAADAVALFDVIQTVDRPKIADALAAEMKRQGRHPQLYVQVNTGREPQKAGLMPEELPQMLQHIRHDLELKVAGLMCIPPVDADPAPHFQLLKSMADQHGIAHLSMGMSGDFIKAIAAGASHVRIGSAIFGERTYKQP